VILSTEKYSVKKKKHGIGYRVSKIYLETFIWRGCIKLIKSDSDYITISNTVSGVLLTFFIQEP